MSAFELGSALEAALRELVRQVVREELGLDPFRLCFRGHSTFCGIGHRGAALGDYPRRHIRITPSFCLRGETDAQFGRTSSPVGLVHSILGLRLGNRCEVPRIRFIPSSCNLWKTIAT